jgi:hypothetical protein
MQRIYWNRVILRGLLAIVPPVAMHLFPCHLMGIDIAGTVIGAWLYEEPAAT